MTPAGANPHSGTRDILSYTSFVGLGAWAWFLYGFGAMLPLLRAEQGTSRTVMGMHSLALSLGAVVGGLTVVPLVARVQRRGLTRLGIAMIVGGAGVLCLVLAPWATLPATLVVGTGGSLVVSAVSAAVTQHHGTSAGAILSEGNAVAALIGLIAPLAVGVSSSLGLTWRPAILLVLPLGGAAAWVLGRVPRGWPELDGAGSDGAGSDGAGPLEPPSSAPSRARLPPTFWLLICTIMATVGIEFCCTAWAADLLRQRTTLSAESSSAAVSIFVGGLFVGRILAGRLARRVRSEPMLVLGLLVILAGWTVLWFSRAAPPALTGLGLLGVGVSVQFPLIAALAYASAQGSGDQGGGERVSRALSLGIGCAAGMAPFAIGAVADATSTHTAFVLVPVLAVVALTLLAVRDRAGPRRTGSLTPPAPRGG